MAERGAKASCLLYGQLFESGQGAGEEADDEGRRRADDVQHGGRQDGDVGVLPGEGVEQGDHCVAALRQGAAETGRQQMNRVE